MMVFYACLSIYCWLIENNTEVPRIDEFMMFFCVSALLEFNQSVLVSRKDPESRKKCVSQIRERVTSDGRWPQVHTHIKHERCHDSCVCVCWLVFLTLLSLCRC